MFQLHVVDRSNRHAYAGYLEDYFKVRHDIYVGERGWLDLARADGREIDDFDSGDAIYLLGICPQRKFVAGSRLLPSLKPHLLNDVFPQLAEGRVPRGEDVFEWTRFFVVPALRSQGRPSNAAGVVYCGIVEFCLKREIRQLSVVCEPHWLQRFESLSWNPVQLGSPLICKDGPIIGILLNISEEALSTTRTFYGITQSVISNYLVSN